MALILREADVRRVLTMADCLTWLEEGFRAYAAGRARNLPRRRVRWPEGILHTLPAADLTVDAVGLKTYTSVRGTTRFLVLLYSASNGELLALIEADYLGAVRTGAASGVATRYLARDDARRVGMIGAGSQARTQLAAVAAVRPIERAVVWSRDAARRERFCREMAAELGLPVEPAASAEAAVREQDIVITITTARQPVLSGEWLSPGTHINAAGSNSLLRREIDDATLRRVDRLVVDSRAQAPLEAGDLQGAVERGLLDWDQLPELADVVAGRVPGRQSPTEITLFESLGLGLEDITVAKRVYERARAAGLGEEITLFAELQPRQPR